MSPMNVVYCVPHVIFVSCEQKEFSPSYQDFNISWIVGVSTGASLRSRVMLISLGRARWVGILSGESAFRSWITSQYSLMSTRGSNCWQTFERMSTPSLVSETVADWIDETIERMPTYWVNCCCFSFESVLGPPAAFIIQHLPPVHGSEWIISLSCQGHLRSTEMSDNARMQNF